MEKSGWHQIKTNHLVIGAGIAGLVTALELLKRGEQVLIVDAQGEDRLGGLARIAFGGMALIGTPEQKRLSIPDSPERALRDWMSFAELGELDIWPKQWAELYCERSRLDIYDYIRKLGVRFLPAVNWIERGWHVLGNSLPRYHILWGGSAFLVEKIKQQLYSFPKEKIRFLFNTKATKLLKSNGRVNGCLLESFDSVSEPDVQNLIVRNLIVRNSIEKKEIEVSADNVIIAAGGFSGDLERVKKNWPESWGHPPQQLLNGSHPTNDGRLHDQVIGHGGQVTHLNKMWNYAAGVAKANPEFEGEGLSLIPCKSALWLDASGARIGPEPLVTGFDTYELCQRLSQLPFEHSWQVLNRRIAEKELAISGAEHNPMIRDRKLFGLLKETLLGNSRLVNQMLAENECFVSANNLKTLVERMNQINEGVRVEFDKVRNSIETYDQMVLSGKKFWNDEQLRRITQLRRWSSEKIRTCYPKPIIDGSELIAIKLKLITRKSLGGIQTNLNSQVMGVDGNPIEGLFAVGEAAGFGGGGASGKRSLEGTFIAGCILTARQAVRYLTS
ncbi:FAD-binding protein [Aliikangiella sp. G2MR2-5]|uniref:FAD-binding protein n=1 Tax=Aliikangiella sp. G2MR2-5 TaxID=2788943 RepID=UPI0018AB8C9D|nr:FAD-binding protein [Aliikangiella sp. G2MR2-5]